MTTWPIKTKVLVFVPMFTGSLSFLSSLTIISMIFRSDLNIAPVYKRLILGMSFFDLIQSLSQALSSLPMPTGTMFAAAGNDITCELQGFTTVSCTICTIFYSLSLSIYFISIVRFEMLGREAMKCIEPLLHVFPIVLSLSGALYLYIADYYNPSDGTFCWLAPQPLLDCLEEEESTIECMHKWNHLIQRAGFITGLPIFIVFAGNMLTMAILWHVSYTNARRSRRRRPIITQQREQELQLQQSQVNDSFPNNNLSAVTTTPLGIDPSSSAAPRSSSPPPTSVRQKVIILRAIAYIVGFIMTHIFSMIFRNIQIHSDAPAPFIFELLSRIFFPLQGFINLTIYSYPYVASYRRINEGCTWIKAFFEVIRKGEISSNSNPATNRNPTYMTEAESELQTQEHSME